MARTRWIESLLALALAACPLPSLAAGDGGGGGNGVFQADDETMHSQPDYRAGVSAIKEQRWADAIKSLERHLRRYWQDADGQNWLGYANRKAGRLDAAFKHYKLALNFNPRHLGAHEYIGEAYVMSGQVQEARKHLEQLAALCGTQCEQYRDLAAAIEHNRVSSSR